MKGFLSPLAVIGQPPEHRDYRWHANDPTAFHAPKIDETAIVEAYVTIDAGIDRPTAIGPRTMVMKHAHVGHDAQIGANCNIAPGALIGGHVIIGGFSKIGMGAMIRPRIKIGTGAIIGMGAVVVKDVPPGETWAGNPAAPIKNNAVHSTPEQNYTVHWTPEQEYDAWEEWWKGFHK